MRMKRTRPIRGDYFLTIPRVTHEGRILEIKVKVSQVIVTDLGPAKKRGKPYPEADDAVKAVHEAGEIERGSVDGEEDVNPLHEDGVDASPE